MPERTKHGPQKTVSTDNETGHGNRNSGSSGMTLANEAPERQEPSHGRARHRCPNAQSQERLRRHSARPAVVFSGVIRFRQKQPCFSTPSMPKASGEFLETLSTYARTYLDQLDKPDVDSIEGLPPTVAIDQRVGSFQPRSTVGTITEIYGLPATAFLEGRHALVPSVSCRCANAVVGSHRAVVTGLAEGTRVILLAR